MRPATRLEGFGAYFFAALGKKIAALRAEGLDVIRIDIGAPDMPPPDFVVDALVESARRPDTHSYTTYGGTPEIKAAFAAYYRRRFEVELDPAAEVLALIGSKEGLFHLAQALVEPGDVVLIPDPGYPTYRAGTVLAGAEPYFFPLLPENDFLPDLEAIPAEVLKRAKILWLNYPNNPTSAVAPLSFFEEVVAFARKHDILIAHDAPYVDVTFDGYEAPSILQVPGAKEVAVEFNSLSKSFNMAGWRLGCVVGNAEAVRYVHIYKSQVDTSQFLPVLQGGIAALTEERVWPWVAQRNAVYQERRDIVVNALREAGIPVSTPKASLYVWMPLPEGETDSMAFCDRALRETGVSMTPGVVFGPHGEGFVRISLGTKTERLREAMERLAAWLK